MENRKRGNTKLSRKTKKQINNKKMKKNRGRYSLSALGAGFGAVVGIGNECCNELHDIFFRMDIVKRIKVHTFSEIDRIEHPNLITVICEHFSALDDQASFRKDFVKIKTENNALFFTPKPQYTR